VCAMSLRKEVLDRLILAKSILSSAGRALGGQPNAHVIARRVLNAHDAADLVFASIADHQHKLRSKGKASAMMECLALIDSANKYEGYFRQLNEARNGLKHVGNLPNSGQWADVIEEVFDKLSDLCVRTLGTSFQQLDRGELLFSDEARAYLAAARAARLSGDFRVALEEIGKALFVSLEHVSGAGGIQVGSAKAEDALKLTAFGVSANDFLRLQEFLPLVSGRPKEAFDRWQPDETSWKQSEFGHPGNWREEVVDFCIEAYLDIGLRVQDALPIPNAIELWILYQYRVTAKDDQVEVWRDAVQVHRAGIPLPVLQPQHRRYLKKGESVTISASTKPLVSEDLSADGKLIKRVQVSRTDYGFGFGADYAEFVNFDQVEIVCVPAEWTHERYPALSEVPWQEDPVALST
jgi:hypothetical protein